MAEPVFATKWHFLLADVLFGVHAETGELLLVTDPATERTMTVPGDYADELRGQSAVFPGGVVISWRPWVGLPRKAAKLVDAAGRDRLRLCGQREPS